MDITDFKPKQDKSKENCVEQIPQEEMDKVKDEYGNMVELFLSKYGEMSEGELIKEMLKIVTKQKRDGTFDAEKIKQAAEKIEPLLSEEQRAKMQNLMLFLE
ncbi:MAG: hypothetical protein IKQ31_02710 [Clostridia bacterium]|nr:hypothetical protein [Clostridia bacterium]